MKTYPIQDVIRSLENAELYIKYAARARVRSMADIEALIGRLAGISDALAGLEVFVSEQQRRLIKGESKARQIGLPEMPSKERRRWRQ